MVHCQTRAAEKTFDCCSSGSGVSLSVTLTTLCVNKGILLLHPDLRLAPTVYKQRGVQQRKEVLHLISSYLKPGQAAIPIPYR